MTSTKQKKTALSGLLSLFVLSISTLAWADKSKDVELITALDVAWSNSSSTNKDPETFVSFYDPENACVYPPNAAPICGIDNIRDYWTNFLNLEDVSLRFWPTLIDVSSSGDMAWESGEFDLSLSIDTPTVHGKYIVVWKKTKLGWKAERDMFSPNQ